MAEADHQCVVVRCGDFPHGTEIAPAYAGIVGMHNGVVGELNVVGGKWPAVVPLHTAAHKESERQVVGANYPVFRQVTHKL